MEDALTSAGIRSEDRKDYQKVVATLDKFFSVRRNVIFERARFNLRSQQEGESAEEFIMALYSLAEDCDYEEWKEEMIRDRLVVGIRDAALSQQLQWGHSMARQDEIGQHPSDLCVIDHEERIAWMKALIPGSRARFSTSVKIFPPIPSSVSELHSQKGHPHSEYISPPSQPISPPSQPISPPSQPISPHSQPISPHSQPISPKSQPVGPKSQPIGPNLLSRSCVSSSGQGVPHPYSSHLHGGVSAPSPKEKRNISIPNATDSQYCCGGPASPEAHAYFELVDQSQSYLEPVTSVSMDMRSPDVVPRGSSKGCQDSASSCSWNVRSTDSVAEDRDVVQVECWYEKCRNTGHRHSTTSSLSLSTEEDEAHPQWTRARTATVSLLEGEQLLNNLQKEALFIPPSSLSDYVPIGKGQFGEVFRATLHKGTPGEVLVAVKTTKKNSSEKDKADFLKEMMVMSQILHPNIVRLYGLVVEGTKSASIVLEYLSKGDLKHFLTANPRPTRQLVKYMIDVAMGMHYISEKGLVHRDLAARNVLVGENEVCKVADFGLLRELSEENSIYQSTANAPSPVRWMAPESIKDRTFSAASDVRSYGVLMWEMFNPDKKPYDTLSNMECAIALLNGTHLPTPSSAPSTVARLMKSCWHKQPERRPSFLVISTILIAKGLVEAEQK
ncbi:hypothetical protein EMCRGX_G034628 [Ephydatia muelleri]